MLRRSLPFELHFIAHSPSRRAPRLGPVQRRRAERQHAAHTDAKRRAASRARVVNVGRPCIACAVGQPSGQLEEDFAALRKLRDESECDELKQAWGANDPREWKIEVRGKQERCVQVKGDRVTMLGLCFSSLAVLPDAIGELHALTDSSWECTSLVKLPAAIGELGTPDDLFLDGCSSLEIRRDRRARRTDVELPTT